jgi:carbamoyltransferase
MKILSFKPSISKYFGSHDAAVILLDNNKIVSILEEERFTRSKNAYRQFPINAISKTLTINHLTLTDIDYIAIPFEPTQWFFAEKLEPKQVIREAKKIIYDQLKLRFADSKMPPISFYNHHLSHAASTYYLSDFDDALIITIDGTGEREATAIFKAEHGKIEKIEQFDWPNSLGNLYSLFTKFLGFKPLSAEGKTMGLAAYGKYNQKYKKLFDDKIMSISKNGYKIKNDVFSPSAKVTGIDYIKKVFSLDPLSEKKREKFDQKYMDLAYLIQTSIEETMLVLIRKWQKKFKFRNLCLAGGVGMNCSMNGKLLSSGLIKDIFIQPLAGDNGCMIGSAILKYIEKTESRNFEPMHHLYYGTKYSNAYIKKLLKSNDVTFKYFEKPWKHAAKLIAENKIIGWFNGRMEAGARALGGRSVLSNPIAKKMKDKVNTLKNREKWRPLAMSILEEHKNEYLEDYIPRCADFMIVTRGVKNDKKNKVPAALHIDGTTRPQVVKKTTNKPYYNLIKEFYKITGIPLVINTSMNDRGEPIVEKPEQALKLLCDAKLDGLFLENYFVTRNYYKEI